MSKISTRSCRSSVQNCREFQCHGSLYAKWVTANDGTRMYVVYSYGEHWPLFVCHEGVWLENEDRYSVTTSKHRSVSHPHCGTVPVSCKRLIQFVRFGMSDHPMVAPLVAVSA